jgi:RNA polymerase sigma-70 factor, ECF subfamily
MMTQRPSGPVGRVSDSDGTRVDPDVPFVERARSGDEHAFEHLVHQHSRRLFAMVMSMVRDHAEAEEVVQEAWLSAFSHLDSFRGESRFSTWLMRLAMNHALMRLRKKRPLAAGDVGDLEEGLAVRGHTDGTSPFDPLSQWARQPDAAVLDREVQNALEAGLDVLAPTERALLLMRAIDEGSLDDLAGAFDTTVPAIKSRLHRARLVLRQVMDDRLRGHPAK